MWRYRIRVAAGVLVIVAIIYDIAELAVSVAMPENTTAGQMSQLYATGTFYVLAAIGLGLGAYIATSRE
jgi:hypothetical protein